MPPGIARARIAVLMVMATVVGVAAGGIFDEFQWALVLAPLAPGLAMIALVDRGALPRAGATAVAVMLSTSVALLLTDDSISALGDPFTAGPQRLLSTEWPSPVRGDLVGTLAALLAITVALSAELARRKRWHLAPLAPMAIVAAIVVALSAPLGARWGLLAAMGATAIVFATLRDDDGLGHRLRLLRGERRLVPLLAIATATTAIVSVPIALGARADPRRNETARQSAPLLDPIEATNALRSIEPPITLHGIDMLSGGIAPSLWRTAALANYDGVRWSPDLTLRPIGKTLGPALDPLITYDISFLDDDTSLVPFPGSPVSVGAAVETDPERTVVRLVERPTVGEVVEARATGVGTAGDASITGFAARPIDDGVSGLTELAQQMGGEGTILEQLRRIESTMHDDWELDSEVQGGGLQSALIERFLRDTHRGNTEQFASGFALLARSLGVNARVATGFKTEVSTAVTFDLSSSDASVWPEIRLTDGRWLPFDAVPLEEVTGGEPPPPESQVQTPAAPQPPIPSPPEASSDITDTDAADQDTTSSALSTAIAWAVRGGAIIGAAALPILLAVGTILGAKYRRRRRRLHAGTSADRIRGAWATATDALVDAGLSIGESSTNTEIAEAGAPIAATSRQPLRRLASLATTVTFGTPDQLDALAGDAASCLVEVESTMARDRSRWNRLRWRLSLRSLRSSTRSPVTG